MRFIKKISSFVFPFNAKHSKVALLAALLLTGVSGCGSDSDKTTPTGFLKVYNASGNSPAVRISIDDRVATSIGLGGSAGNYELDTGSYEMELAYQESDNSYFAFNEDDDSATISIADNKVNLFVISGDDIKQAEITRFQYANETPEDGVSIRVINAHQDNIDVFIVAEDQTDAQETPISLTKLQMSEAILKEHGTYQLYVKEQGSTEAEYTSEVISFSYNTQYVFVVRASNGPSGSKYTVDQLPKSGSGAERPDYQTKAEVRFYNGVHDKDQLDFTLNEVLGSATKVKIGPEALLLGEESKTYTVNADEYTLTLASNGDDLASLRSLALGVNTDKTVFFYTETTTNDDGVDVAEVKLLPESNSTYASLYEHNIKMINLVEELSFVRVFFLKNGETTDNYTYSLDSSFVDTKPITLLNNTYDVLIKSADLQNILYKGELTFADTGADASNNIYVGDLFLVFEKDSSDTGYKVTYLAGNDDSDVTVDADE